MFFKRFIPIVLLGMMMVSFLPTHAQNGFMYTVYCGDLSEADCELLTGSVTAMQDVTSATIHMEGHLHVEGVEMEDIGGNQTITYSLDGVLAADYGAYFEFQASYGGTLMTLLEDPSSIVTMDVESLQVSQQLIDSATGELTLTVRAEPDMEEIGSISLTARIVDGIVYADAQNVYDQVLSGEPPSTQWVGIDLGAYVEEELLSANSQLGLADITLFGEAELEFMTLIAESDLIAIFSDPEFQSEFITVERVADQEIDGQTIAVFETRTDFGEILRSETFVNAVIDLVESLQEDDPEFMPDVAEIDIRLIINLLSGMLPDAHYTTELWIGTEDLFQYRNSTAVYFEADFSMMGAEGLDEPMVIDASLQTDLRDFNAPVEVEVPTDVEIVDLSEEME